MDCFGRFSSSVRRAIRKAEASGLSVEISQSQEAVGTFHRLHTRTRRRHGLPPQALSFFRNIHEEIIRPGAGFIVTATHGGRPIAAAVFFQFGAGATYKFGASDERQQGLRGNNLVMWKAIAWLAENGFETLHFGRTLPANDGLRRFKLSWGTTEEKVDYHRLSTRPAGRSRSGDKSSGFHTALFRRLPLAVNRLAGAILYPHLD